MKPYPILTALVLSSLPLPAAITALTNADFESGVTGNTQDVPGWFDFVTANGDLVQDETANTTHIPDDVNGRFWLNLVDNPNFTEGPRGVYQSFGTHDAGITSYQVNFTIGQRSDTAGFGNISVSLYSGTATGADGTPITSLATLSLADIFTITGTDHFATTTTKATVDLQISLDASGIGVGETLWIAFAAIDDAPTGGTEQSLIDDISITAIPEPSAALLGGLGVLALLRRRRA